MLCAKRRECVFFTVFFAVVSVTVRQAALPSGGSLGAAHRCSTLLVARPGQYAAPPAPRSSEVQYFCESAPDSSRLPGLKMNFLDYNMAKRVDRTEPMKSTEVYRIIRDVIAPWCKTQGFKRTKGGMLGWYKPVGNKFLVFWFQCSMDGWDNFAGSRFVVDTQLSDEPIVGSSIQHQRLPHFLDDAQLEQVRQIQNMVTERLKAPPETYFVLHISPSVREWYLAKFQPITRKYANTDDIWLRYFFPEDVRRWAEFALDHLPSILESFATNPQI